MDDRLKNIEEERGKIYGEPIENWTNIGKAWTATLRQHWKIEVPDMPADVACILMSQMKLIRSVNGVYHKDNFDDSRVYSDFAERAQKKNL